MTQNAYAIFESGGKQHRVKVGQRCKLELICEEPGSQVAFDKVLMVSKDNDVKIGAPFVAGSKIIAKVLGHGRGDKVHIFKMRRRKNSRRQQGHRQGYTEVQIEGIQ